MCARGPRPAKGRATLYSNVRTNSNISRVSLFEFGFILSKVRVKLQVVPLPAKQSSVRCALCDGPRRRLGRGGLSVRRVVRPAALSRAGALEFVEEFLKGEFDSPRTSVNVID